MSRSRASSARTPRASCPRASSARASRGSVSAARAEALQHDGPLLDVELRARRADGSACAPVRGKMLVDTGASTTAIDLGAVEGCAEPSGTFWAQGVTAESAPFPTYEVAFGFPGAPLDEVHVARAVATPHLASQGLLGLAGRDFLQHGVLTHDGPRGVFALRMPGGETEVRAEPGGVSLGAVLAVFGAAVLGAAGAWLLVPGCR